MGGFGGGVRDDKTRQHFVNALEAHSWVEVFFPGNGWIPFEPTPDGTNSPINLPLTPAALNAAANAPGNDASLSIPRQLKEPAGAPLSGITPGSFSDIWRPALIVAGGLLVLLAARCRRRIPDRKSTRLNSSHTLISYAGFCLKKKKNNTNY